MLDASELSQQESEEREQTYYDMECKMTAGQYSPEKLRQPKKRSSQIDGKFTRYSPTKVTLKQKTCKSPNPVSKKGVIKVAVNHE